MENIANDLQNILSLAIIGTLLSGVIAFLKNKFGLTGGGTKVVVASLALLLAGGYVFLKDTPYWQTFLLILMTSQTIYGLLITKDEKGNQTVL